MGTRSLTRFFEDNKEICCIYQQFDGYPSGVGAEIAEFLASGKLVNGFGQTKERLFNGMGCMAAQFIAQFKRGVGGLYLYPPKTKDAGQEYEYHIYGKFNEFSVKVTCLSGYNDDWKTEYSGDVAGFAEFCKEKENA